jgi:hypothetical protein
MANEGHHDPRRYHPFALVIFVAGTINFYADLTGSVDTDRLGDNLRVAELCNP